MKPTGSILTALALSGCFYISPDKLDERMPDEVVVDADGSSDADADTPAQAQELSIVYRRYR